MKNNSIVYTFKSIANTFRRLNLIIFIVTLVGGLIAAILILSGILQKSAGGDLTSDIGSTNLDQATINRLNKLKTSDNNQGAQPLPSGRINPFSE